MRKDHNFLIILQVLFALLLTLLSSSHSAAVKIAGKDLNLSFLPFMTYAPETKLAAGVGGIYTFRSSEYEPGDRPSSVTMSAKYTQLKQYEIRLIPDLFLRNEEYHLKSNIFYQRYPMKFYGIGNSTSDDMEEDYTLQKVQLNLDFQRRILTGLNVGVLYEFEKTDLPEVEKDGSLAKDQILGSEGGTSSGIGVLVNFDDRDRMFSATRGGFYQISSMIYRDVLGSDYKFTRYSLDLRRYFSILPSHTLTFRTLADFVTGEAPFGKLSLLGAYNLTRGYYMRAYYPGRYRDKNLIVLQAEYRVMPVWWRVGLVGFVEMGDVSDAVGNFELRDFKSSVGLGLRYQFNRDEGVNLRGDFAYGDGYFKYHFTIFEAF